MSATPCWPRCSKTEERFRFAIESFGLYIYDMDYVAETLVKTGIEQTFYTETREYKDLRDNLRGVVHPEDLPAIEESWLAPLMEERRRPSARSGGSIAPTGWSGSRAPLSFYL